MRAIALALLVLVVCCGRPALADTHYVSQSGTNIHPYTTPETAAWEVQDAIDAADPGDRVEVGPGTFVGRVELKVDMIIEGGVPRGAGAGGVEGKARGTGEHGNRSVRKRPNPSPDFSSAPGSGNSAGTPEAIQNAGEGVQGCDKAFLTRLTRRFFVETAHPLTGGSPQQRSEAAT